MKDALQLLASDDARSARVSASLANVKPGGGGAVARAAGVPFPFDRVDMLSANPREQLTQPYKNSVWVMRAIKKISGPISAVPLEALDATTLQPVTDPALLAFLAAPVKGIDQADFNEAAVGWLKLAGEAFLIGDDTWLAPFAQTRSPLIMARPDQMRHVVDNGQLIGWEYRDYQSGRHLLLPEQVWQKKNWNPYDQWRGLSEYEAARIAAEGDYYAGEFVRNMMANNGDQGVYIVAKNGIPNDAQRAQIIADLREKRMRAQRGEFRAVFLAGDIEVQDPKISAPDANLVANRMTNRHEVFIAFGVPASMADVQAAYSIGSASDRFILIEETSMPTGKKVASLLAGPASKFAGRPILLQHNWDDHSTMQAVRRERLDAAQKLWSSGMPWKEVNDYLRLGMRPFAGWDIAYVPFNLQVVGAPAADPTQSPAFSETDDQGDESVETMLRSLERRRLGLDMRPVERLAPPPTTVFLEDDFRIFACDCAAHQVRGPVAQRAGNPKAIALWKSHMAKRRATIAAFKSAFGRVLMQARVETLKKIDAHYVGGKAVAKAGAAASLLFDLADFASSFKSAMQKQQRSALDTAGQQLLDEVGFDDPFVSPPDAVKAFLAARENKLRDVPQEIFDRIKAQLDAGIEAGDTTAELAARVKVAFNGIGDGQALRIASTETGAAYGAGRNQAMDQAGVRAKAWLTSGNANVRPAHEQAGLDYAPETPIDFDEPFIVDGEELMFPGDDNGSAGNVINCHCVSIAVAAPKSAGS